MMMYIYGKEFYSFKNMNNELIGNVFIMNFGYKKCKRWEMN